MSHDHHQRVRAQRLLKDWLIPLALVALVVTPLRSVIADWNDVPSGSMRPTIVEGDRITVNKLAYGLRVPFTHQWVFSWGGPKRGEIVTFASPLDGQRLVKRVVALPGDRIEMRNQRLIVNGEGVEYEVIAESTPGSTPSGESCDIILASERLPIGAVPAPLVTTPEDQADEPAVAGHMVAITPGVKSVSNFPEQVVPEGCYFMLGDNRDFSSDSRVYGFVPRGNIYGRVGYVALSLNPKDSYLPRWERWFMAIR